MNFKRSVFTKILAVSMCVISTGILAANSVLLGYLVYNSLYYNNKEAIARELYNFIAIETAYTVNDYVDALLTAENPDCDSQEYWINQSLRYESRLSQAYSNASFKVYNLNGDEVLSGYELPDIGYEFTYHFAYYNPYFYDDYYEDTTDEYELFDTTNEYGEPVTFIDSNVTESTTFADVVNSEAEETTETAKDNETEIEEPTTFADKTTEQIALSSTNGDIEESSVSEEEAGQQSAFSEFSDSTHKKYCTYYSVCILVPQTMGSASDLYSLASDVTDIIYVYKSYILPVIFISLVILVLSIIVLFVSAGYTKKSEKPIAGGLHKIPFDISLLLVLFITFAYVLFLEEIYYFYDLFAIIICVILTIVVLAIYLAFIESIIVRIKTKTLLSNNLIARFFGFIKHIFAIASSNISLTWKTALGFCLFTLFEFIIIGLFGCNMQDFGLFLFILLKLIEIPLLFVCVYALYFLQQGAKKIADGQTNYKIAHKFLFGEFKKHADSLNNINQAINKAVGERVKSENMKTELITNVSHDLKTPLTSLVNYIDLLKKTEIDNETANEYIDVIDRQAQRLKKLTVDIVDASKAATGNIEVHNEKTVLNVMLTQATGEYSEQLENKNLSIVQILPEEDICIFADGRLLWRVFDNIFNNICKYSLNYTRVYLSLENKNGKAVVTFKNISSVELNVSPEELTERFVRGDSSRNTEGSGLGLSIAKSLCEIMDGKFDIFIDGDLFKVVLTFDTIN